MTFFAKRWVFLFIFFFCFASFSWALKIETTNGPILIDISLTSALEWHKNRPFKPLDTRFPSERVAHDEDYWDLQNKLNIAISYERFRIGGQLDTYNFFGDSFPCHPSFKEVAKNYAGWNAFPMCKQAYVPEKLFLTVRLGSMEVTFGDFYITLGRGAVLQMRKQDEFGQDMTLRGGRMDFEKKGFKATVAGGFVNESNLDIVEETFLVDPSEFIFAMDISQKFFNKYTLGAHYVFIYTPKPLESKSVLDEAHHYHMAGGSLSIKNLLKKVDFYFVGNALYQPHLVDEKTSYAFYSSLNAYLGAFNLQWEGQWYERYSLDVSRPSMYQGYYPPDGRLEGSLPSISTPQMIYFNAPSMEDILHDTQGDNSGSKGFKLRLDYTLPSKSTFFWVSYLFRTGWIPDKPLYIHHGMAGGEHRNDFMNLSFYGGFRQVMNGEYWRRIHGQIDTTFLFLKNHSIKVFSNYPCNKKGSHGDATPLDEQTTVFQILDVQVGYNFSKYGSISFLFAYSDEDNNELVPRIYPGGELKINIQPVGGWLKLFYGRARGGLRCVSGVCRIFPPFEGFRTEFQMRF